MNKPILDLYSDYLICSYSQTPATRLSNLLQGAISHDKITRSLAENIPRSKDLWQIVKTSVRTIESPEGVMVIDDSIEEKPYTDENDIVCWHYDHAKGRQVKGINFMTSLYCSPSNGGVSLPVGFQVIAKTEHYIDVKTSKEQRRSPVTKNIYYQRLLQSCVKNNIQFRYVLNDIWYASAENMTYVRQTLQKHFVMPIKTNRKVALSKTDKRQGKYSSVDTVTMKKHSTMEIYLEKVEFPLTLVKQVFENGDGSMGVLYLVTSHTTLSYDEITTLYRTRWHVEEYHKSLKQNVSLEKSPTRTVATQTTHFFAALCAYIKLEMLKVSTKKNHTALKLSIYMQALASAYDCLRTMEPIKFSKNSVFA